MNKIMGVATINEDYDFFSQLNVSNEIEAIGSKEAS
jgi:hypothetical protein